MELFIALSLYCSTANAGWSRDQSRCQTFMIDCATDKLGTMAVNKDLSDKVIYLQCVAAIQKEKK